MNLTLVFAVISFIIMYKLFKTFGKIQRIDINQFKSTLEEKIVNATENASNTNITQIQNLFPEYQTKSITAELDAMFTQIFSAFANSRHEELKKMLSADMYESFAEQIAKREDKNLRQELDIIHQKTTITKTDILTNKIVITVLFEVSQMSATINSDNVSYDNPNKLYLDVKHQWVFERSTSPNTSSWILIKTTIEA